MALSDYLWLNWQKILSAMICGVGAGSVLLCQACSLPRSGGSEGHILRSECPVMYWLVAQSCVGQMPTSRLTCIDVPIDEVSVS